MGRGRRWRVFAFWSACAVVGVMSLLPQDVPLPSTGWDKSNHAIAFVFLAGLGVTCWRTRSVLIGLALYGGAIEIAQTFTATRFGDVEDWIADLAGLAIVAAWRAYRHD